MRQTGRAANKRSTTALVAAVSVAAHLLAILLWRIAGPEAVSVEERGLPASVALPAPSCGANVLVASALKSSYCLTPFAAPRNDCLRAMAWDYRLGLNECHGEVQTDTAVAFLSPDQIRQIEPIPLADLLEPDAKPLDEKLQEEAEKKHERLEQERARIPENAQVVEITRPKVELAPNDTKLVSEFNSRVVKQTVARGSTEEMVARPSPRDFPVDQKISKAPVESAKPLTSPDIKDGPLSMKRRGSDKPFDLADQLTPGVAAGLEKLLAEGGTIPRRGHGGEAPAGNKEKRQDETLGEGGEGISRPDPRIPDLRPSDEKLARLIGGGSVDDLDIEAGEETALNTRGWKYASFFNRLKRQVAQNWRPGEVHARRDPNRNVYGTKDRLTVLQVSLTRDGSLEQIYVVEPSRVGFLDEEAMRAFRAAQPFPNPPVGLVDEDSKLITFRFSFKFEIGSNRTRWKVFRYR